MQNGFINLRNSEKYQYLAVKEKFYIQPRKEDYDTFIKQ